LKQPQYQPLHFADQVISIYAGTNGYFDKVPVNKVAEAEKGLLEYMRQEKSEIRNEIIETGALSDELIESLKVALTEFQDRFVKELGIETAG
jgi:F-type H+-transporting ATPase subunit alpha